MCVVISTIVAVSVVSVLLMNASETIQHKCRIISILYIYIYIYIEGERETTCSLHSFIHYLLSAKMISNIGKNLNILIVRP